LIEAQRHKANSLEEFSPLTLSALEGRRFLVRRLAV